MPNRIIKEAILTSCDFNRVSLNASEMLHRLAVVGDNHGCFRAEPPIVKGRCYPLKPTVRIKEIIRWLDELEQNHLIMRWVSGEKIYGSFICQELISTKSGEAFARISEALKKLGGNATRRQIALEARCSYSTIDRFRRWKGDIF